MVADVLTDFWGWETADDEVLFLDPFTNEPYFFAMPEDNHRINVSILGTYPPKQAIGDWTRSHHEVLSFYVQSDTSGGGQVKDANEATDLGRFWWATLDTRRPRQITLPLRAYAVTHPSGDPAIPLGEFGDYTWAAFGVALCRVTPGEAGGALELDTLAHPPVNQPGVVFKGTAGDSRLFIPMGEHGYQIWDGTGLSALYTDCKPISLIVWDNKLYALQADGKLLESISGVADWVEKLHVEPATQPRLVVDFYNRQDEPALHIVTRRGVFGCDLSIGKAALTKLTPPPHPESGLAACQSNADLYVSYGLGVHLYTGNSIIAVGLDRNAGLPADYRGRIVSMTNSYTGLYALVRGREAQTSGDLIVSDSGAHDLQFDAVAGRSYVMNWNTYGWSTAWVAPTDASFSSGILVSAAGGDEWLWWGHGDTLYCQDLSYQYFNPEQRDEGVQYEQRGVIEYPELDFEMTGQDKLLHAIEIRSKLVTATETITVEMSLDSGPWTTVGVVAAQPAKGMTRFLLGANGLFPDNITKRYDGIAAERIQVRCWLERGADATKTPLLESVGVVFHKLMGTLRAYQFVTDTNPQGQGEYKGRSTAELQDFLLQQVAGKRLVPMLYGGEWRSVRFAGISGDDGSGVAKEGFRNVAVLEVIDEDAEGTV